MRTHIAFAALTGLMLRIYLVLKFPVTQSGDAPFYIELAWNWLKNAPSVARSTTCDDQFTASP